MQPLPAVDVSPLQLPLAGAEGEVLLQQLIGTRQLFDFLGAFTPDTATPVLRVLWQLVCYGEQPYAAYQQAVEYYRSTTRSGTLCTTDSFTTYANLQWMTALCSSGTEAARY